jgi:hypothetical protein
MTRSLSLRYLLSFLAAGFASYAAAQDDPNSRSRLKLMEQAIKDFEVRSSEINAKDALTFAENPLLRYSDPTRGLTEANVLIDATVWRLGKSGRPTALVTLEIYRSTSESGVLAHEFLSLSPKPFSLNKDEPMPVGWEPIGSALEMRDLPGAPEPAKAAAARLIQMRQLTKRFSVNETVKGKPIPCRLLTQPIDRYKTENGAIVDGAIFAFANATNPEAALFLECDDARWSYGIARLTSAETSIELDGRVVASYPHGEYGRRDGVYSSAAHPIDLSK